jgi:hypothetical protein
MKQSSLTINKNIDIKFIAHDAFLESMNDTSMLSPQCHLPHL